LTRPSRTPEGPKVSIYSCAKKIMCIMELRRRIARRSSDLDQNLTRKDTLRLKKAGNKDLLSVKKAGRFSRRRETTNLSKKGLSY